MTVHRTALIVEDSPTHRIQLKSLLQQRHFNVIEAENGEQAAQLFDPDIIDVVFMDIIMPKMDGYASIREIRLQEPTGQSGVPIILITAVENELEIDFALASGATRAINKPFSATDIDDVLDTL